MPIFSYQAKQGPAEIVEGTIEAQSQEEVVTRLLRDGLVPVTILIKAEGPDGASQHVRRVRVSAKERRTVTRQLTSLLRAKVELAAAIAILKDHSGSRPVRLLLDDIERQLQDGHPFSEAIARHPRVFPTLFLSGIRAGEASGKLDDILTKLVQFDEQQERLESRLRGALAYPLLLLAVGSGCLGFFIWFIVPRMAGLFAQLGGALPWPTRLLIGISHGLSQYGLWLLGALFGASWLLRRLSRSPLVRSAVEQFLKRVPFIRDILDARQIGRFTRTLQLLLDSGLPVFQALEVARPTMNSAAMEQRLRAAQEMVRAGQSIAHSLREARCFPPLVSQMIAVGESAGTLVEVLDELASYYERCLDEALQLATTLLEPLMILVMGVLVAFCVLAMVLPIFQMTQLVQ